MRVLVSGSGGFVGRALLAGLEREKHEVLRLVRSGAGAGEVSWDPSAGRIDSRGLEGLEGVVHLAGETIMGRWNEAKKQKILQSRREGTRLLAESLAKASSPPKAFISASAIGYYGDRGDEILTEESSSGSLFLSQVCREWEAAASPAAGKGIRVANLRFGMILGKGGGALAKMITPFKLGLGGIIGSGKQWMSWISLDEAVNIIVHSLTDPQIAGPVNTVSPQPVTNYEFTKTLGRVLRRPTLFPMPAFAARLAFGQMADELLLASARVEPSKLKLIRYGFKHPGLEDALRELV